MLVKLDHKSPEDAAIKLIKTAIENPDLHPEAQKAIVFDSSALHGVIAEVKDRMYALELGSQDVGDTFVNKYNELGYGGLQSIVMQVLRPQEAGGPIEVKLPSYFAPIGLPKAPEGWEWVEKKSPTTGIITNGMVKGETVMAEVNFPIAENEAEFVTGRSKELRLDGNKSGEITRLKHNESVLITGPEAARTYAEITKEGAATDKIRQVVHQGIYTCSYWILQKKAA